MQIYNILPAPDGSWKAILVGEAQLIVSNMSRQRLIDTMTAWAEKSGDPLTIRIHNADGVLEEEQMFSGDEGEDAEA